MIATLTRTGSGPNARFDVASIPAHWGLPASWGRNVLNPFHYLYQPNPVSGNDDMFRVDFSSPGRSVTSVRIDYGDYYDPLYLPTDGNARFQAFDSNGNMIADQTQYWNGDLALGQFGQFTFNSAVPIAYIRFWGEDDPGNNTLFWDNLQIGSVVAVPGPAAAVSGLAGLSLVAGGRLRRNRRAHCGMA